MSDFLNEWVSSVLDRRADKSWTPSLHASPADAEYLGTVSGLPVAADDAVAARTLVMRGAGTDDRGAFEERDMAVYCGITYTGTLPA